MIIMIYKYFFKEKHQFKVQRLQMRVQMIPLIKQYLKTAYGKYATRKKRNVKDTDVLMPVYNLLSGNYSKKSESLF